MQLEKHTLLGSQKTFLDYSDKLDSIAKEYNLGDSLIEKNRILSFSMKNCELVIPIVGSFSSGKSTMLNTILDKKILPTAITPETSLAMELRYAEKAHLEAVAEDGNITQFPVEDINDIKKITDEARLWTYARLYLDNDKLKAIEPLILVDMPGFDAPIEQHNKAIMTYLSRGCHYFVLLDIQDGTISKTLLRHLHEIENYGREFTLFITKTDLKPQSELEEIEKNIEEILCDEFDFHVNTVDVNHKSSHAVVEKIKSLNPDILFRNIYTKNIANLCNDFIDAIDIKIKGFSKNENQLENVIENLQESITVMKEKAKNDSERMRKTYSSVMVNDIVQQVGAALSSDCDEIATIAAKGNRGQAESRINDIVRCALVDSIKEKLGNVNEKICKEFAISLQNIDKIMSENALDDNFIQNLTDKIQNAFISFKDLFEKDLNKNKALSMITDIGQSTAKNAGYKVATGGIVVSGLLGSLTSIITPILGIVMVFLPEILSIFFKDSQQKKIEEAIRSELEGNVFPSIKRKIREALPSQLESQISDIISEIENEYAERISEKAEALSKVIDERKKNMDAALKEQEQLKVARDEIVAIANSLAA